MCSLLGFLLRRLGKIIKDNANRLFIVSVELDAWESVNREYLLEETFHSPYALAGFSVLLQVRKWASRKKIRSPIEFVFVKGDEGWDGLENFAPTMIWHQYQLPKEKAVPCHIGDFVAWKNRIAATNSLRRLK